jgi:uncharacterized coiled-coil protein SlyX
MDEENTTFQGATIAMEEATAEQDTPFDRLESRIDALIEKYEQLVSVHSQCEEKMAGQEARIRELESKLGNSEQPFFLGEARFDPAGEGRDSGSGIYHSHQGR